MASFSEILSMEGKSLRKYLTVVSSLLFVLPFMVFTYILYTEGLSQRFNFIYLPILLLSLTGLIILRQIFDKFVMVTFFMKKAEAGEIVTMEMQKSTAELMEISLAFNTLMKRLNETGKSLEEQTEELKRAVTDRLLFHEELEYRLELERLISGISARFINIPSEKVDEEITNALGEVGEFAAADRSYLFLFTDEEKSKIDNTHEWCAEGIEPQIDKLKGLSVDAFPWWIERLRRFENIYIPKVDDLPDEATAEREILKMQDIKSLMVIPLVCKSELKGFLGFDSVRGEKDYSDEDITLLRMAGEIIVNVLERKRLENELKQKLDDLERMNRLMVERELRMEEIKKEIARLKTRIEELEGRNEIQD